MSIHPLKCHVLPTELVGRHKSIRQRCFARGPRRWLHPNRGRDDVVDTAVEDHLESRGGLQTAQPDSCLKVVAASALGT